MKVEVELTKLSEDELDFFAQINPDAVRQERDRRNAYSSIDQGLSELAQASFELQQFYDNSKKTAATRAIKDTGILEVVQKLLAWGRANEVNIKTPEVR